MSAVADPAIVERLGALFAQSFHIEVPRPSSTRTW